MNSLLSYGSDDDYDDSSEEKQPKQTDWRGTSSKDKQGSSGQTDVNYEEVQMELSEGSNDSSKPETKESSRRSRERDPKDRRERDRKERRSRDKDSKYRDRRERDRDRRSRRSPSRERRRSRSPKRSERDRSRSRDRARKYPKRYERVAKTEQPERNGGRGVNRCGVVIGGVVADRPKSSDDDKKGDAPDGNRFFMPGITGRFRDQIERRKQLWQKKETEPENKNGQSKKVWETTTFAQDTDGKVASKFKRLMGIRGASDGANQGVEVLRKQEEMFSSMEQQYEVARTATHTMRGVGLGFGSFQR